MIKILLFACGAMILFAYAVARILRRLQRRRCYTVTHARVKSNIHESLDDISPERWHAVVEYYYNGTTYTEPERKGTREVRRKVGEELIIHYNPNNPKEFYVADEDMRHETLISVSVIATGLMFLVAGLIVHMFLA